MLNYELAIIGLCTVSLYMIKSRFSSRNRNPLPPGPPAIPVIGHAHLIPQVGQDVYFYELSKIYGTWIPSATMTILGFGGTMGFIDDGEDYRAQRKMFQQYFGKERVREHRVLQEREARGLALNLLRKPEKFKTSFLRFSTAVIIELTFGHRITSDIDPYVEISEDCSSLLLEVGPPGATPVDFFPFLQHFPSWFPGAYYAGLARKESYRFMKLLDYPFEQVKKQM
ncbi:hypothetical protein H0H93_014017, partial [Arthromyces matolae]